MNPLSLSLDDCRHLYKEKGCDEEASIRERWQLEAFIQGEGMRGRGIRSGEMAVTREDLPHN